MNSLKLSIVATFSILVFNACNSEYSSEESSYAESEIDARQESAALHDGIPDTARKVIRKADIKCRVNNVEESVSALECFTIHNGGIVAESNTGNIVMQQKSEEYKTDSLKNAYVYAPKSTLTLRIPVEKLDTLTAYVAGMSHFTDHRNIENRDVTLNYLSNTLKNNFIDKSVNVLDKNTTKDNFHKTTHYRNEQGLAAINRDLDNKSMLQDIAYSTVTIELYQPWLVSLYTTQNPDALMAKSFGQKVVESFGWSIDLIESILLFFVAIWPLIFGGAIILFLYKRSIRRHRAIN